MTGMRTLLAAVALALLGACLDTPSDPTWVEDVRPILFANCVRCHGPPPISQSPFSVRLDTYGTTYRPFSDSSVDGAADIAGAGTLIKQVFPTKEGLIRMPPRFPLTDRQLDIIKDWADAYDVEAGTLPPRTSRDDNHPPEVQISGAFFDRNGGHAELWLYDEDVEDYLTGVVYAVPVDDGDDTMLPDDFHDRDPRRPFGLMVLEAGPNTLDFTTTDRLFDVRTAHHYDLYIEIDDGIEPVTLDLGFIDLLQEAP